MSPSSKHRHDASSSSSHYRRRRDEEDSFGGEMSEEEGDSLKVTIEQHRKWRAEGTPLESQNKQEGEKKEEATIQGRKQEGHVIQVEPDAPQMQGLAVQSSFIHSGPMADSESGIMSYAVLLILVVAEVILGLDFFGVL